MSEPGFEARKTAHNLLSSVLEDQMMLSEALAAEPKLEKLEPSERAQAQSIATGVLRHHARLAEALRAHLRRPPPLSVHIVLVIAAYETRIAGIPPHAAVSMAVNLARRLPNGDRYTSLVNAVARKAAETELPAPTLEPWFEALITRAYGKSAVPEIALAHSAEPPTDLTPKSPAKADSLAETLGAIHLPTGSIRLERQGQISALPGYQTGEWWVQDAAAALPVRLLGDISGLRVLDLCAAPGGKTMQLAAAGAEVTALDISRARLQRVAENLERTGLTAELVTADALTFEPSSRFDLILLDAPCSATGTVRRHPDLPLVRPSPDLRPLLALQEAMIDKAFGWLAPKGRLLYCTCSLLPKEGERQIARALERNAGLSSCPFPARTLLEPEWSPSEGQMRLRPDFWAERGGMDGFFAALLQKS